MASTYTNLGVELMATGENAGTWGTKTNANLQLAEQLLGGFKIQTLNAAGSGANTTALAVDDGALTGAAQNRVIILGAVSPEAITGNKIVTFPLLTETFYFIKNSTSGAYTVQLKAVSGSGATVTFSTTDKGYKLLYLDGVATNTGVIEIPLATAGTVTETGTQTLTNKTLTSPKIGTSILDTNGNELALLTATGSAINEFTIANAATGAGPTISSTGDDTNIDINITPKGSGDVVLAGDTVKVGDSGAAAILTSNGAGTLTVTTGGASDLVLSTNSGTNSGTVTITDAANGDITISPNGTGIAKAVDAADATGAIKIAGKETIWIPAVAMYGNSTNGAASAQVELSNGPEIKVLDFDKDTDEFAQFAIAFPKSWNAGTVTFQAFFTATSTNTGTTSWGLSAVALADSGDLNTAFGTQVVATAKAHSGTSNDLDVAAESGAVTIAGSPAANEYCFFQVSRDVSADNLSADARLLGIKLFFTTNAANDG